MGGKTKAQLIAENKYLRSTIAEMKSGIDDHLIHLIVTRNQKLLAITAHRRIYKTSLRAAKEYCDALTE